MILLFFITIFVVVLKLMNNLDKSYTDLLQDILDNGYTKGDRTGTGTLSVFGRQIRHKMSDSEKRSACQQKRRAEKTHDKSGTGNKPKMVSYKKKPTNESIEKLINRILKTIL